MTKQVQFKCKQAGLSDVVSHLLDCDSDFVPPLSERVNIPEYALKIVNNATTFEAWAGRRLVGLIAAYCDGSGTDGAGFVTNVSVARAWQGKGVAAALLNECKEFCGKAGIRRLDLEVNPGNLHAIRFYIASGFVTQSAEDTRVNMSLHIVQL